ncbi:MAG: bacillithiol biosynthesis cysteine-adding enzyme BshC [Spirochaetes bacterium RBG_13_68_11]|nr:MAG: bacillithiol biosynthesis cysteine-adding enzyme BshC [Spirochaetes bacterium RBG_13_68_11]
MPHSVPLREIYRGTSIVADYWEAKRQVTDLLPRHFLDRTAYRTLAGILHGRSYDRSTVATVLEEQNRTLGADAASLTNARRLLDPRALVVVGGQQAGLFGGPLYTLHKALTVQALAGQLEKDLGCPVVPVFWIASDDHDLAEVARAWVTDAEGRLREVALAGHLAAAPLNRLPVSQVALGADVTAALEGMAGILPATPFSAEVLSALRASWRPASTFAAAFGEWMHRLLDGTGIVTADPSDARLKRLGSLLFAREIGEPGFVGRAVAEQTARLAAAGYPAQIDVREGMLTLFLHDPGRTAIESSGDGLRLSGGRRLAPGEVEGLLEREPGRFSPNAALRPLFQDTLFPTVAMVLGPAELAYCAQLGLAYERLDVPMPVLFPRASLTLLEPRITRLMAARGITLGEAIALGPRLANEVGRRALPEGLAAHIGTARSSVAAAWEGLVGEIDRLDHTLRRTAELAAAYSARRFDIVEKKTARALVRRDAEVARQAEALEAALAPRGGLQERTLCPVPFAVRWGMGFAGLVARSMDIWQPEHRGITI